MPSQRDWTLEDILSEVLMQDQAPSAARLISLCAAHPSHKAEIVAFFEVWAEQIGLDETTNPPAEQSADASGLVEYGVAQALTLLLKPDEGRRHVKRPHLRLSAIVRSFGLNEAKFARACGLDEAIMGKLDRRCIQPVSDIPIQCFERMSETLVRCVRADTGDVNFHLSLAHAMQDAVSGVPLAPLARHHYLVFFGEDCATQSFVQAIESSSLSEEEKRQWLGAPSSDVL